MVIKHPAGQHGFGGFLDPLVDESGDFISQIGSVVEASQLKTLQGSARSGLQVVKGRCESRDGHGLGSS